MLSEFKGNFLFCKTRKEAERLLDVAKSRIPELLREFSEYCDTHGKLEIKVYVTQGLYFDSVEADLLFDGKLVRHYESYDMLEFEIINIELNCMLKNKKNRIKNNLDC